jgi:hypothetical protein
MEYRLFGSAKDYGPMIAEVAELFSTVFRRSFPAKQWSQWYLENPYGDPYVALGYHGHQLVGHHALIPQYLVADGDRSLRYFLSASTMVHPHHRNLGVFLDMVVALHDKATNSGAHCILAFPNANSAPLFERLYEYRPVIQSELCNWSPLSAHGAQAASACMDSPPEMGHPAQFSYPTDSVYWIWRTQINHAETEDVGDTLRLVYKGIEPATLMLLDLWVERQRGAADCLARFATDLGFSTVRLTRFHAAQLGIPDGDLTSHEDYSVRLFGLPLTGHLPDIRFSLLLSDVF